MNLDVMLASSGTWDKDAIRAMQGTHWLDVKWDGVRALAVIENGNVMLINRNRVDITYRYPDLVRELVKHFGFDARLVLDGEIIVRSGVDDPTGQFKLAAKRDRQTDLSKIAPLSESLPATYMVFDLLLSDDEDLRNDSLRSRLAELNMIMSGLRTNPYVAVSPIYSDPDVAIEQVETIGYEGLIAKRVDSTYRHGRQKAWVKLKPIHTETFAVLGIEKGSGYRADTFGALLIGQQTPAGFQYVGKVGSGFDAQDLDEILELWKSVESGERTEPIMIEVSYQEVTEDGALRFPTYVGIRSDV